MKFFKHLLSLSILCALLLFPNCGDSDDPFTDDTNTDNNTTTILDADGDGVADADDPCPDTPRDEMVDENGCSDSQKDSDGDGVIDDLDNCPETTSGETVNTNGCSNEEYVYPNILLIIADDLGNDMLAGFNEYEINPLTPTLDSLRASGVSFTNVWSSPICSPTRAGLISGQYGFRTGVLHVGDLLDEATPSIQQKINEAIPETYAHGIIGKWHLSGQPTIMEHPYSFGLDYFAGVIGGSVGSYYEYPLIVNNERNRSYVYATEKFTTLASDWIKTQVQPWFLWMTHVAPHTPHEVPPEGTYSQSDVSDILGMYLASIESLDYYINQLISNMDQTTKENTLFIFMGDNGTDNNILRGYSALHGKGTLYEGGVRVPLIVSGPHISRKNATDASMIQSLDLPSLILDYIGISNTFEDSQSFLPLLNSSGTHREYLYSESVNPNNSVYAVKNLSHKLLVKNENEEFYDLQENLLENENLLNNELTDLQQTNYEALKSYVLDLKNE